MFRLFRLIGFVGLLSLTVIAQEHAPLKVSLVQLIATPEKFDGKLVSVQGFLAMGREGDLLYMSQADADNVLLPNAIWIRRTEKMGKDRPTLDMKYVRVVGIFRIAFHEHLGTPTGGIPEVKSAEFWSDPSHPMSQKIREIPGVSK